MLPVGMPHPAESQELIAVAAGNDLYLVVWTASAGHVPNIQGVRVRASDGAILDPTPLVISTGASPRLDPAVAFDGNNFLVVWTTIEGAPTLHGARVRASDGAVLDTPPLWLSRAGTPAGAMPQGHAAVAFDGSGNYLVTWEGTLVANNTYSSGILGIRVRASDGTCVESTATLISGGSGRGSRVAYAQGNFLVTWRKSINDTIEAARVSASTGQVLDTAPILLAAAAADPAVAARHDEFLVVWRGADGGLWGRRVRAWDGARLGTADIAMGPAVAAPADVAFDGEDYWISWQGTRDGVRQALTTRVTAEGEVAADAELVLGEVPAGSAVQRGGIAAAGSGLVLSVYAVKDPVAALTRGRMRLVKAGQVHVSQELSPSIVSAHLGNFYHPAVAEGDGMYLVVWSQLRGPVPNLPEIVAVRVRASDGARLDATPLRLSGSSDIAAYPDVAFDGSNFLVVWTDLRDTIILGARVRASDGAVLDPTPLLLSLPPWSPAGRTLGMNPTVAFDGTNYLVTWGGARTNSTDNMNGIMGIRVRPSDGWTFGWSSFVIVPVPFEDPGQNYSPEAAYANGSYLVAWTRDGQVKATRVSASTGQVRDVTPMSLGPTASIGDHSHAVAARGDEFLVLWRGTDGGLWGRRIRASDGVMLGTADIFVGPGLQGTPSATFDGADYWVAWPASRGGGTEVVFTRISPEGVVEADAEQSIVPLHAIADASQGPRLAAAGPGSFLVTYLQGYPVVGGRTRMRLVNAAPADCDSRVPTLTLNGSPELMLECGSGAYRDPGAVAFDGCGRPLQVHAYNTGQDESGPGPNLGVEGTYMVAYAAWDAGGHTANALRTVNVDDRTPPTLTLLGAAHMTHTCGSQWVDPGVQAMDACYGNITHQVWHTGEVNGWAEGTYTVTYTLTDSGGNSATPVTRTVDVLNCPW